MWIFPSLMSGHRPFTEFTRTALHLALRASNLLTLPFDLARAQHAAGVRAGMLPRSLLESSRFERQLATLERLALGPLARRV